jgi:protein TonB
MIRVDISSGGSVKAKMLMKSSGYPDLDREALRAVSGWKFRPAVMGGFPVATTVTIPLRFEIHTRTPDPADGLTPPIPLQP